MIIQALQLLLEPYFPIHTIVQNLKQNFNHCQARIQFCQDPSQKDETDLIQANHTTLEQSNFFLIWIRTLSLIHKIIGMSISELYTESRGFVKDFQFVCFPSLIMPRNACRGQNASLKISKIFKVPLTEQRFLLVYQESQRSQPNNSGG